MSSGLSYSHDFSSVGWVLYCCVCVACSGVLCAVLWERFLEEPTLLSVLEPLAPAPAAPAAGDTLRAPAVALCPSPPRFGQILKEKLSTHVNLSAIYPVLGAIRYNHMLKESYINHLEPLLLRKNLTVYDLIMLSSDACDSILRICRWGERTLPCADLFTKEMTFWGACCVASVEKLVAEIDRVGSAAFKNPRLELLLQCPKGSRNCIELVLKYLQQENVEKKKLQTGQIQFVEVSFLAVKDSTQENLVDNACDSRPAYSQRTCAIRCLERKCGCLGPLHTVNVNSDAPPCSIRKMNCLYAKADDCRCPPACRKVTASITVDAVPIENAGAAGTTYDPLFGESDAMSSVLVLRMRNADSRMFELTNTETWWSLLSSLGGVFNMFLAVGAISAVELVFFSAKLLHACRRHAAAPQPTRADDADAPDAAAASPPQAADAVAAITDLPPNAVAAISDLPPNAVAAIRHMASNAVAAISGLASNAAAAIPELASNASAAISDLLPNAVAAIPQLASNAAADIPALASNAVATIPELASNAVAIIPQLASNAAAAISEFASNAVADIPELASNAVVAMPELPSNAVVAIPELPSNAVVAIPELPSNAVATIPELPSNAVATIPELTYDAASAIPELASNAAAAIPELTPNAISSIPVLFSNAVHSET